MAIVLHVDLKKTDRELSRDITARCSSFGVVRSVKVHRDPTTFALIKMVSHDDTLKLTGQYGVSTYHNVALVPLEQES